MQETEHYKSGDRRGTIDARVHASADGDGYIAEFSISQDIGGETFETLFTLPSRFPDEETAMSTALQAARHKIKVGFEFADVR